MKVPSLDQCRKNLRLVLFFAYGDTRARYRRSVLGPFWIVIGTAIGVMGLGYLYSSLLKTTPEDILPSLTVGIIIWQLIAGVVGESAMLFVRAASILRNIGTPAIVFPLQLVARHFINFLHGATIIVLVLTIYPPPISLAQLLLIPGLLLLLANLVWISLVLGLLGARYRDIELLIGAVLPMLFFLSPVIFRPDHVNETVATILWYNPLTYLILIVREPLEGVVPSWSSYGITLGMLGVGSLFASWLLATRGRRLALWV